MKELVVPGRAEILRCAVAGLTAGPVLVHGPAGYGRTTVLAELVTRTAQRGRILRAAPGPADAAVPWTTLADLLDELPPQPWRLLAEPQRAALRQAVRRDHPGTLDRLALRLGFLALLRVLGAEAPVLLVLDDVQWADSDSVDLLAFAARRTGPAARFAAAELVAPGASPLATWLSPATVLELPPLTLAETTDLLRGQGDPAALHQAAGGHPRLVLELSRSGGGLTEVAKTLLRQRLDRLDRAVLLRIALAGRVTVSLLYACGLAEPESTVDTALRAGVLDRAVDGALSFRLPLLADLVVAEADPAQLRQAHEELAAVSSDPVEQARQLARARPAPAEDLARTLAAAAGSARQRGLPAAAAELGALAADRTPVGQPKAAVARRLAAATDAVTAGAHELARTLAAAVLTCPHSTRKQRVTACLALVDAARHTRATAERIFRRALAESRGEPALEAPVRLRHAVHAAIGGDFPAAAAGLARAAQLAHTAGDQLTEVNARCSLALCQVALGDPAAEDTLAAAAAVPVAEPVALHGGVGWTAARLHLFADRLPAAQTELANLFELAEERGELGELVAMSWSATEVLLAAGRCGQARQRAGEALRQAESTGTDLGPARYAAALAEAVGGDPARAAELAAAGLATAEADGDQAFVLRNLHALGLAGLAAGDPAAALEPLRRAGVLETELAVVDPAVFGLRADLAEALVATGAQAEATEVLAAAAEQAQRLGRRGVLATLARADGIRLLLAQQTDQAVRALESACAEQAALGQPVQYGRSLLWLGIAARRRRRRAAARETLRLAHRTFAGAGATPWAARALAVLGEDQEQVPCGALTGLEHRIARLVAGGATNREVAARLNVSGKTVEGALTRIYRKLAVRSRTELALRLPDPAAEPVR
ncbi:MULTISPECIES: AAA family ATPase [unclassified Crossiella]|uniref:AAA family ATPase n=1 Tax=unclassified Crossiella TaxID=2620835 RepID=UPI001FFEAC67|nr:MULTISPECIES: LuxR family transcriptional regulator [unclassified Crossiella]MCK2236508.1 AAA family ATPase [Crossiella sp. S99.2]MCK2250175.1 AAA family ATPase [Crossiella sp. S99.1]